MKTERVSETLFGMLVLGCLNTDFCNQILIWQDFSRSTVQDLHSFPPLQIQFLTKIRQNVGDFVTNHAREYTIFHRFHSFSRRF